MISIIITAFKEANTIGKAIESIQNNNLKDYEILVICPDDETRDVALKFKNIKYFKDPGKGKPSALNLAFKTAKGDILVLTDGDVFVDNNSINNLLKQFENDNVGAISGHPMSINSKNNMFGFWAYLLTNVAHDLRSKGNNFVCSGYLMAIRQGLIESIPENSLVDDAVISNLILDKGLSIAYAPEAIVYVKYPNNFNDWIKQKIRSSGGYYQLKEFTKSNTKMKRSFLSESSGVFSIFKYITNFKEFLFTLALILARFYLWFRIFYDIKIRRKDFSKIWKRIESTK